MDVALAVGFVVIVGAGWRLFRRLRAVEKEAVALRWEVGRLAAMRTSKPEKVFGQRKHPPD